MKYRQLFEQFTIFRFLRDSLSRIELLYQTYQKNLVLAERQLNNINDENLDSLIEEIEGKRLKIEDTSLVRRGLFRTMSRKMSFTRPGIPNFDEFETQSLARFDSQASINSVSSRISVKSAFTKSPTKLFQKVCKLSYDVKIIFNLSHVVCHFKLIPVQCLTCLIYNVI